MATLFKRATKSSQFVYYGNAIVNGKRYRKKLATSKEAAERELKRWEYNLLFVSQTPVKIAYKVTKARLSFLIDLELTCKLCDKYFNVFSYTTRNFMEYCHKHNAYDLSEVSSELARNFFQSRCNARTKSKYKSSLDNFTPTLSVATVNKELQIMKRFFNYCIDMDWIDKSPFQAVKAVKQKGSGGRYHFSDSDIKMIMESAGKFHDFYYLLLHTGIRATDAFKLNKEHIKGNYLHLEMNKTGDILHIPLAQHVLDLLMPRIGKSTLFPRLKSSRQRRNAVKNIQRLYEPNFVRGNNINLHTFRHTYAHNMLNKGVPKEVLQTLLGHRSIKTTEIYANFVRKEELEKWV